MRARETPCTRRRIRPSGSFNMRMIAASVPISWSSAAPGVSLSFCFCRVSMITRCSASAASTALIDFSRETERGTMM